MPSAHLVARTDMILFRGTLAQHSAETLYVAAAGCALLAGAWAAHDFRAWQRLGSGGLPGTIRGWLRTTWLRMCMQNPLQVAPLRRTGGRGFIDVLPARQTRRPRVGAHPVPHRQLDQRIAEELRGALQQVFDRAVQVHADAVHYALSFYEKHTLAVTLRHDDTASFAPAAHGEIAHIHALDGSMHMVLSPQDAALAVERGWAELHGLAGRALDLPPTYVMVYAPQTVADVAVIATLLEAAVAFADPATRLAAQQ